MDQLTGPPDAVSVRVPDPTRLPGDTLSVPGAGAADELLCFGGVAVEPVEPAWPDEPDEPDCDPPAADPPDFPAEEPPAELAELPLAARPPAPDPVPAGPVLPVAFQ
jgi:hypothetical protein